MRVARAFVVLALSALPGCGQAAIPVPAGLNGDCSAELLSALGRGDERAVEDLVARGAVGDCSKTRTAVESAIREDRGVALDLLLRAGANPNRGAGEFPEYVRTLSAAVEGRVLFGRSLQVARVLLEHGVNTEQRDNYSWNPKTEYADDTGAPYQRCETELRSATALIAAAVAGDVALVGELLEFGANLSARDADGRTALDYAHASANRELIWVLEHHQPGSPASRPLLRPSGLVRPC